MAKRFYGIRFKPDFYSEFKKVAKASGYTVTGAYADFMAACIEANKIVIPSQTQQDYETQARVLMEWLQNGDFFFRSQTGEELSIVGCLFSLIPKLRSESLRSEVEIVLKQSVAKRSV